MRLIKALLAFLFFSVTLFAQVEQDSSSIVQKADTSLFVMQKSPWGAVGRSALLPGWGQIYNESYWKVPIFLGAFGGFLYGWSFYNDQYWKYAGLYQDSITESNPNGDSGLRQDRDFYRDERDTFMIYLVLTYFLNLVDAYVDAHLFDFDVSENFQINSKQLNMRFYFNR